MNVSEAYKALGAALVAAGQLDAGSAAPPAALLVDNGDGTVTLTKTGHTVPKPKPETGELRTGYFQRIATLIGSTPDKAASLMEVGGAYDVSKTGDPIVDWPINVDSFANPEAYGTGKAGDPPVVAV